MNIALYALSHFALIPSVVNADEVIVKLESMKQKYVNALLGHFGDTPDPDRAVALITAT